MWATMRAHGRSSSERRTNSARFRRCCADRSSICSRCPGAAQPARFPSPGFGWWSAGTAEIPRPARRPRAATSSTSSRLRARPRDHRPARPAGCRRWKSTTEVVARAGRRPRVEVRIMTACVQGPGGTGRLSWSTADRRLSSPRMCRNLAAPHRRRGGTGLGTGKTLSNAVTVADDERIGVRPRRNTPAALCRRPAPLTGLIVCGYREPTKSDTCAGDDLQGAGRRAPLQPGAIPRTGRRMGWLPMAAAHLLHLYRRCGSTAGCRRELAAAPPFSAPCRPQKMLPRLLSPSGRRVR